MCVCTLFDKVQIIPAVQVAELGACVFFLCFLQCLQFLISTAVFRNNQTCLVRRTCLFPNSALTAFVTHFARNVMDDIINIFI